MVFTAVCSDANCSSLRSSNSSCSLIILALSPSASVFKVHCKQLNILPIKFRFDYHDLKLLHSIIYNFSCIRLPDYIKFFSGSTRLRSSHLDSLSLVSSITPCGSSESSTRRGFSNSYFYRAHLNWNKLPFSLRETIGPGKYKRDLITYIWKELVSTEDTSIQGSDSSFLSSSDELA